MAAPSWPSLSSLLCVSLILQEYLAWASLLQSIDGKTYVIAKGLTINPEDRDYSFILDSKCPCRRRCLTWVACLSWSYNPTTEECHLTSSPLATSYTEDPDTYLSYLHTQTEPGEQIVQRTDGLYYFYSTDTQRNYTEAKAFCESRPGFHLPNIITQQHFLTVAVEMTDLMGTFWLGLQDDASGNQVWENGILFSVTQHNTGKSITWDDAGEIGYQVWRYSFHDYPKALKMSVVCQGNLEIISWM